MDETSRMAIYPSLEDRVVLVTGGASGIGEAMVEAFCRQKAQVIFFDVLDEAAERLTTRLGLEGMRAPVYLHCDLTDTEALRRAVEETAARFSTVDVLVNNAGDDMRHAMDEVTPAMWDALMAVNLKQQFFMIQAVAPTMRRAGGGSIVNMSSISWVIPSTGLPVYVTAKAGIVGMTRTLAHELGRDGIRVNCLMPGAVLTERQRRLWLTEEYKAEVLANQALKRLIVPEEVARLVLFLAAEDSSAVTNQSYVVDGGWV